MMAILSSRLSVFVLVSASISALQAGTLNTLDTPCAAGSLASYIGNTAGCSVGIENFTNFMFLPPTGNDPTPDTAANILVTPATQGFNFSQESLTPFTVPPGDNVTYYIQYHLVIDPAPVGSGADLGMDPPFGNVSINQAYCADSTLSLANGIVTCTVSPVGANSFTVSPQYLHVDDTNPPAPGTTGPTSWCDPVSCVGEVAFQDPIKNFADVVTEISIGANSGFDGVSENNVTTNAGATPEPLTGALALGGLLAIVLRKRLSNTRV